MKVHDCGCTSTTAGNMTTVHSSCLTHQILWDMFGRYADEDRIDEQVDIHGWQAVWDALWGVEGWDADRGREHLHARRPGART